jgi:hypothetical protein
MTITPALRVAATILGLTLAVAAAAQTYIGNLDGSSNNSTFTTSTDGTSSLTAFGWTTFSGLPRVFGQTGGTTNDVVIGNNPFDDYSLIYYTGITPVANTTYTLNFLTGFVSGGASGSAMWTASVGDWDGVMLNNFTPTSTNQGTIDRSSGPTFAASFGADANQSQLVTVTFFSGASPGSDQLYVLLIASGSSSTPGSDFFGFDNVTLSTPSAVPEPSAYAAIAGACALGLAGWRRRHARLSPSR